MNKMQSMKENIERVMIGQEETIELLLVAILAEGHVLIEDMPGTGKTVLSSSLAKTIEGKFNRIQFTPDLLPSDVTGLNYYNQKLGEFVFREGPAFCNILLADELNRATPRTQSSLLECMAERQITIDGETRKLEKPFMVIATQNPLETLGTYPLPEAQLDRFLMRIQMTNPSKETDLGILKRFLLEEPLADLRSICNMKEMNQYIQEAREIMVHPLLLEYIADLANASREDGRIEVGISPRGSLALLRAVRAYAYLQKRTYVVPEDVKKLAIPVLAHRIKLTGGFVPIVDQSSAIERLLQTVPIATEEWEL
ncbi:MAG: AAA family ATPase [Eubacteriales bacterium]